MPAIRGIGPVPTHNDLFIGVTSSTDQLIVVLWCILDLFQHWFRSPVQCQAITSIYAVLLSVRHLETHLRENLIEIQTFAWKKMYLKMLSTVYQPCCSSLNMFGESWWWSIMKGTLLLVIYSGIILCMCPANERQCYIVTSPLIGWAHTQNDPCLLCDVIFTSLAPGRWDNICVVQWPNTS